MSERYASGIHWVKLAAGIWLIISPYVLGYTQVLPAVWNNVAVGILAILAAAYAIFRRVNDEWLGWVVLALGVWEIVAPFVLGFDGERGALWTNVVVGVILVVAGAVSARAGWVQSRVTRR